MLGDPVEHSLSPLLHTTALEACGLNGTYVARRVDAAGMAEVMEELRRGELDGANVTMPHKRRAHDLCDRRSGDAAATGAVNTLVRVAGEVVGHNTDVGGVRTAWNWAGLPTVGPVDIYGAGGAAAAAVVALRDRDVVVRSRRPEAAEELVTAVGHGAAGPWAEPRSGGVLVNATPVGMGGEAFPDGWLGDVGGVFDMAYGSGDTPAVEAARRRGLPVAAGLDMLLAQALASFWLWTGRRPPADVLRRALQDES